MPARTLRPLLLLVLVLLVGCAGGAYPERDGAAALKRAGESTEVVQALVDELPLDADVLRHLYEHRSEDVRWLVARHPDLPVDLRTNVLGLRDDFVRSGMARNASLTSDEIERLARDESHTVYCSLAGNPIVPAETLDFLREERDLDLSWFAWNPKCPEDLRAEIRASDDELAKRVLEKLEAR